MMLMLSLLLFGFLSNALAAPIADTSGCGISHPITIFPLSHTITSSTRSRSYTVHLPSSYNAAHQYPVIVGYHGSSSIGLFFEVDTKLDEARYTADKIMVYPNGVDGSWAGANYSTTSLTEDFQFTHDMLVDLRKNYCVDDSRIYATGLSNGGGFVGALACNDTVGGEFAAFAAASGAFYTDSSSNHDSCKPARSVVPMLEFHGGADESVHYEGGEGEGGIEPSITEWLGYWAERNGCTSPPEQEDTFDDNVHHLIWTCQGISGALQHYKVDDMKHDWPSTEINFSQIAAGDVPTHIDASAIIQEFFGNFTKTT